MRLNHAIRAVLLASAAFSAAAEAADAPANAEETIEDVVVTATRVESSAQKTAISLTVYSADALRDAGVANVQSLATVDPSISVTQSTGAAYVAIRGIASTDLTEIGDPSVPIARDNFFTNRSYSIQVSMYDVDRVEVLKGPQGTLSGRNSTGGLIRVLTKRPGEETGGFASVDFGNYGAVNLEGAVNIAASDRLQMRASVLSRRHEGYRDVSGANIKGDDEDVKSGRFQIAYQVTDNVRTLLSYQHDQISGVGDLAMVSSDIGVRPDFGDGRHFRNDAPALNHLKSDRFRWELEAQLPADLTLTYLGGFDRIDWQHKLDATDTHYPSVRHFVQHESPDTWNHEVRISTPTDRAVAFQAGYFSFRENNSLDSGLINLYMTGPFAPGGPLSFLDQSNKYGIRFVYDVLAKSTATFGQVTWTMSDSLKASAGVRYTKDKKVRTGDANLDIPALASPFAPSFLKFAVPGNGNLDDGQLTWHVGLDWSPSENTLVYGKVDTGYKSGGFNSNGSAASLPYDPEKLLAVEFGTKNRFADGKLQFNAAAFWFDYKGYQASQFSEALGGGDGIFNVGKAKIYGAEASLIALVGEGGRVDANAAFLSTKFGNGIRVRNGGGTVIDISGNDLPNAPALSLAGGFQQEFAAGGGHFTARIDGKYSSSFYYSVFNLADTKSKAYVTGNLSLGYAPDGGKWNVQAYVRNFTDKVVLANAMQNYNAHLNNYQFQPPRTFGVRASLKF